MKKNFTIKNLKKIIDLGGATLDTNGDPVSYASGWQVSKKDLYTLDLVNFQNIVATINKEIKKLSNGDHLGLWVEDQKIYIDLSIRIKNKKQAIKFGRDNKQISIFGWKSKKCFYLNKGGIN